MKARVFIFTLLALLLVLLVTPVYAQGVPSLPHAFYGAVTVNGSPAAAGTQVEVRGEGVQTGVSNNPLVTTAEGLYGGSNPLAPKLIVQGNIAEGAVLSFYVNGVRADQTATWHSGEVTELNLTATLAPLPVSAPPPAPPAPEIPPPAPAPSEPPPVAEVPPAPAVPPESPAPASSAPAVAAAPAAPAEPPLPPAASPAEPINWTVVWCMIGGVMVALSLIILGLARRAK